MAHSPQAWPPALVGTPAVAVIERALGRGRLGHSLLLHGNDLELLYGVALAIADRLLQGAPPERHPDFFVLRPTGKARQITADPTRELINAVSVSAAVAVRKVAVIYEADRMNAASASVFLKTLEEPPVNTMLILLTTHPYALLPTIRSRCLHFRFPSKLGATLPSFAEASAGGKPCEPWLEWLADYRTWQARISGSGTDKAAIADLIFSLYGLVARFKAILDESVAAAWAKAKESLPPDLEDEEQIAIESGISKEIRSRYFTAIEEAARAAALPRVQAGDAAARRALASAVSRLERNARLFALNLGEIAALEDYLLSSLRLWSRR